MQDSPSVTNMAPSKKVSRMLGLSLHSWEDLMIFALAIVGVFGVLVGVATFAVVRLQRAEIAASKQEFEEYKLEASKETAEAYVRAAEATKIAEGERLARIKIEEKLAPRTLASEQQVSIITKLGPFTGTWIDLIVFPQGTADILPLAHMLFGVLEAAGWKPRLWTVISSNGFVWGIPISVREGALPNVVAARDTLVAALRAERLESSPWDSFKTDKIEETGASGINGPPWVPENVAPVRMLIGTKQQ